MIIRLDTTGKEKMELINLRRRCELQREEIKRLQAENAELKERAKEQGGDGVCKKRRTRHAQGAADL